jgi:Regulator of arginine metabolism and related MADS box-containing transcription factors
MDLARRVSETATWDKLTARPAAYITEDKSLVLLQVNGQSIYNNTLDFFLNLVDTCNPDVLIARSHGLESTFATPKYLGLISQLSAQTEVSVAGVGEVLFFAKNYITSTELCVERLLI